MGCGASKGNTSVDSIVVVDADKGNTSVGGTWATKKDVTDGFVVAPKGDAVATNDSAASIILQDAEEDDVSFELGGSGGNNVSHPNRQQNVASSTTSRPAPIMANAQEAPTSEPVDAGSVGSRGPEKASTMTRLQQEEAAKLAETRKRFDNQRYQQGEASGARGGADASVQAFGIVPASPAGQFYSQRPGAVACLPGGIEETEASGEPWNNAPPKNHGRELRGNDNGPSSKAGRIERKESNFDAHDEAIMTEILEDFDL